MEDKISFFERLKRYGRRIGRDRQKDHNEKALDKQYFMAGLYGHNAMLDGVQDTHQANVNDDIIQRYLDYEKMDDYDITSSILDVYADDASQLNPESGHVMEVKCDNDIIKSHLEFLYQTVLKVDEELWEESRNTAKYGNNFDELVIRENYGVVDKIFRPTPIVRRIEDSRKQLVGFVRDDRGSFNVSVEDLLGMASGERTANDLNNYSDPHIQVYEDFEIIHTRLRGKNRGSKYGYSVLEGAREAYKRLWLLENNQINSRITKGDPKRAFYVDVGNMPEEEVEGFMNMVKAQVRKKRFMKEDGSIDLQYNPNSSDDDFYIPVRNGVEKSRVETIDGLDKDLTESLEYFQKKLHSATKVPRSFLGYEDEAQRVTLSSQDIRFARSVLRVQNAILRGKKKAGDIHLTALGLDVNKIDYTLHLVTPSAIFDEIRYEIMRTQLDIAEQYQGYVSKRWIMKRFLGFQDFEVDTMVAEIKAERDAGFLDESKLYGPEAFKNAKSLLERMNRSHKHGFEKGVERHEKMIEDNMERILKENRPLKDKIESLKSLTDDLRYNTNGLKNVVKSK